MSVDPVVGDAADPQSHNAYNYARNNPIGFVDPNGAFFDTAPFGLVYFSLGFPAPLLVAGGFPDFPSVPTEVVIGSGEGGLVVISGSGDGRGSPGSGNPIADFLSSLFGKTSQGDSGPSETVLAQAETVENPETGERVRFTVLDRQEPNAVLELEDVRADATAWIKRAPGSNEAQVRLQVEGGSPKVRTLNRKSHPLKLAYQRSRWRGPATHLRQER